MRAILILITLACVACHVPTPVDEVRSGRRAYEFTPDMAVSKEENMASYTIKVRNAKGADLQDLTVIMRIMVGENDSEVLWSKQHTLNITGLGNYASTEFQFKEEIPATLFDYDAYGLSVILAPDGPEDNYQVYKEYQRVGAE